MKQEILSALSGVLLLANVFGQDTTALMPLMAETRTTTNADGVVHAQTVERLHLPDGRVVPWRQRTSLTRQTQPGRTETSETVIQPAFEGQPAQQIERNIVHEKTEQGEIARLHEVTRNAAGKELTQRLVEEITEKAADGTVAIRITEHAPNLRGELVLQREEQRRIRPLSANETVVENRIRTYDPLRGRFDETAVEQTEIRKQGATTIMDTIIRRTAGDQNRTVGRVQTRQTQTGDGATRREIVEYGQGLYDRLCPLPTGELKPMRKIIEQITPGTDGTVTLKREVFRLDVNGEWKPVPPHWVGDLPRQPFLRSQP